ncbi:MAG: 16S rRNA (uracil(1498)-N(3))-methyltransferase [Vicinamibacterales bacterium]
MIARVLAPDASGEGQEVPLTADDAAHLGRVLRLRPGDRIRVFDGRGCEWLAELTAVGSDGARARLGAAVTPAPESRVRYTVAMAVLKGDGTDELVRDAVMMGAVRLRPLVAARSAVGLAALDRAGRRDRWQRVAIASAKQCGRAVVPEVEPPVTAAALLAAGPGGAGVLFVEPGAGVEVTRLTALPRPDAVTLVFGPEGGWTADELSAAAAAGWTAVGLGPRTIRAVSMAVAGLAASQAVWDDL